MRFCQNCGKENDDVVATCVACHAPLAGGTSRKMRPASRSEQEPPGAAGLLIDPNLWQARRPKGARKTGAPASERHFLVPPLGEPIRLEVRPEGYVIGRDDECDVRITSLKVSRRHAEVSFRGSPPRAHVKDLGTRNGTRVNDVPIEGDRLLEDGDVLRIGDTVSTYRRLPPGAPESLLDQVSDDTKLGQTLAIETALGPPTLAGDIALCPMDELLTRLAKLQASGLLTVDAGGTSGRLELADGVVRDVGFGGHSGGTALALIAKLKRGQFRFEGAAQTFPPRR